MTDKVKQFFAERDAAIKEMADDAQFKQQSRDWFEASHKHQYSYNFTWMGRPIIQYPQDIVAMQEIIWETKPEIIIETGVAHGGSLILYSSLLQLLGGDGRVLGIDIDIREHNRREIEAHPMSNRIDLLQGSSVDASVLDQVKEYVAGKSKVMVALDSNHTEEHVLEELRLYSPLVSTGCYLIVFDTCVENMSEQASVDRPWGPGNSPMSALRKFLEENDRFEVDSSIHNKLQITVAEHGFLRRVR